MEAREEEVSAQQAEESKQPVPDSTGPGKGPSAVFWATGGMVLVLGRVAAVGPVVATTDPTTPMTLGFTPEELLDPPFFFFRVSCDGMPKSAECWSRTEAEARRARQELLGALEDFWSGASERVGALTEETTVAFFERR